MEHSSENIFIKKGDFAKLRRHMKKTLYINSKGKQVPNLKNLLKKTNLSYQRFIEYVVSCNTRDDYIKMCLHEWTKVLHISNSFFISWLHAAYFCGFIQCDIRFTNNLTSKTMIGLKSTQLFNYLSTN